MAKLNQIIAIEKGIKSRNYAEVGELHKAAQKPALFNGMSRAYQSKEEGDEALPGESNRVQYVYGEVLRTVERLSTDWWNVTARKDWTNCNARTDVIVDGMTLLKGVPVTYLLFLEKQLTDLRTFVDCLPTLDIAEDWKKDPNSGLYRTDATQTHRTKKVQRPIVMYPATPEHPAQTQMVTEDVIAGFWSLTKYSGAMPKPEKDELSARVERLLQAIKQAREAANGIDEVTAPNVGSAVFGYLLGTPA